MTGLICSSGRLQPSGAAVRFSVRVGDEILPAFAIRFRDQVFAYINRCGHRALEIDWMPGEVFDAEGRFLICATHGALFDPESGACLEGPCAGVGLTPVPIVEEGGQVSISDPQYELCRELPQTRTAPMGKASRSAERKPGNDG